MRQSKVHADSVWITKCIPVLPCDTYIRARFLQFRKSFSVCLEPALAVQKEHISALWLRGLDALEVFRDEVAGVIRVITEDPEKSVQPFRSGFAVRADETVHREHIHLVVWTERSLLCLSVTEPLIVNYVITANKPCQIERLRRSIEGRSVVMCIRAGGLGRHVLISVQEKVRPDFV